MTELLDIPKLTEIFKYLDAGEQGSLTVDQLTLSIYHASRNPELCDTNMLKHTLLKLCSSDQQHKIRLTNFIEFAAKIRNLTNKFTIAPETQQIFDTFDPTHAGFLTIDGLIHALSKLKINVRHLNFPLLFRYIDQNHDGKISPIEFQTLLFDKLKQLN